MTEFITDQVENGLTLGQFERMTRDAFVIEALRSTNGNISKAARRINVHRNTVLRFVKEMAS